MIGNIIFSYVYNIIAGFDHAVTFSVVMVVLEKIETSSGTMQFSGKVRKYLITLYSCLLCYFSVCFHGVHLLPVPFRDRHQFSSHREKIWYIVEFDFYECPSVP